jgi:hypothetical protein
MDSLLSNVVLLSPHYFERTSSDELSSPKEELQTPFYVSVDLLSVLWTPFIT